MRKREAAAFGVALVAIVLIVGAPILALWMLGLPAIGTPCGVGCTQYHEDPREQPWVGWIVLLAGVVVLFLAWRVDRRAEARPRQGWRALRKWAAPLLWLVVVPVIAFPATFVIAGVDTHDSSCHVYSGWFSGGADCPPRAYLPSVLVPGLLNLIPAWWLLRGGDMRLRLAAIVATALGVAGLAWELYALYSLGPVLSWDFGLYGPNLPPHQLAASNLSAAVWCAAVIAMLVIAKIPDAYAAQGVAPQPAG